MQLAEYAEKVRASILRTPHVLSHSLAYEDRPPTAGTLLFRYDNALDPAAKHLATYPDHKHQAGGLAPSHAPLLEHVLREAAQYVKRH